VDVEHAVASLDAGAHGEGVGALKYIFCDFVVAVPGLEVVPKELFVDQISIINNVPTEQNTSSEAQDEIHCATERNENSDHPSDDYI
jgi:hypothetical protein